MTGYYEQKRGLTAVHGKEAVQFLNGLITNDVAKLEDGEQVFAAFPNAQGRLLAVVRVLRHGDRFLIETEGATREKVFNNLFRFTYAGDFFVEDLSDNFRFVDLFGMASAPPPAHGSDSKFSAIDEFGFRFNGLAGTETVVLKRDSEPIRGDLEEISDELYEVLRIESGIPKYGIDMDESTIVPELGIDGLISYNKGCYIGQEIIARIHFRGHVAKELTGLVSEPLPAGERAPFAANTELTTPEGKNAGRITSSTFSTRLGNEIALGYVRYDFLAEGTELRAGERVVNVKNLPFA